MIAVMARAKHRPAWLCYIVATLDHARRDDLIASECSLDTLTQVPLSDFRNLEGLDSAMQGVRRLEQQYREYVPFVAEACAKVGEIPVKE